MKKIHTGNFGPLARLATCFCAALAACPAVSSAADAKPGKYYSALDVAYNAAGTMLAASDHTGGSVAILDPKGAKILKQVELRGNPAGVAWSADGKTVFVAEEDAGSVAEVDAAGGKVVRRLTTGPRPVGLAVAAKKNLLLVADSANDAVIAFDLNAGKEKARMPVVREPYFLAVTPDESTAVVGNLLPLGDASLPTHSASVSLIDLESLGPAAEIKLPPGSTNVRKIVVSPEGRWAYVAHTLGRFMLPTTQLERGWMNTNAVTVLDVPEKKVYCTLLLDLITEGTADPWGLAMTRDGSALIATIAGCHQVARLDLAKLHELLRSEEYIAAMKAKDAPPPVDAAKEAENARAAAAAKADEARKAADAVKTTEAESRAAAEKLRSAAAARMKAEEDAKKVAARPADAAKTAEAEKAVAAAKAAEAAARTEADKAAMAQEEAKTQAEQLAKAAAAAKTAAEDAERAAKAAAAAKAAEEAAQKKSLAELEQYRRTGVQNTWLEIRHDASKRDMLVNDLAALHIAGIMTRTPLSGVNGPRGIALSPDDKQLAVAAYFSGAVVLAELMPQPAPEAPADKAKPAPPASPPSILTAPPPFKVRATLPLGNQPEADAARAGEQIFHDATYCFQHWLSCATCHPEGRVDGLNWDLLNDGIGNPKNVKSLMGADQRAPMMAHGVRPSFEMAVEAGFTHILFRQAAPGETKAVEAYLASLKPTPSPRLVGGQLSAKAQHGKQVFQRAGCAECHSGPQLTDLKPYDVGTKRDFDSSGKFLTTTLIELWRTAPYLHDGSAPTIMDVLTKFNRGDKHGTTSKLSQAELEALAEYLLSL